MLGRRPGFQSLSKAPGHVWGLGSNHEINNQAKLPNHWHHNMQILCDYEQCLNSNNFAMSPTQLQYNIRHGVTDYSVRVGCLCHLVLDVIRRGGLWTQNAWGTSRFLNSLMWQMKLQFCKTFYTHFLLFCGSHFSVILPLGKRTKMGSCLMTLSFCIGCW